LGKNISGIFTNQACFAIFLMGHEIYCTGD
jgi:hypothetical protein